MRQNTKRSEQDTLEIVFRSSFVETLPIVADLKKSKGSRLYDALDRKFYLDACGFMLSGPLGYNHPKMSSRRFQKRILACLQAKPSNSLLASLEFVEFVEAFRRIAQPLGLPRLFFCDSRSAALDDALKAAFDWKARLNGQKGRDMRKGSRVLHLRDSYHGRTGYALSANKSADMRIRKFFPVFDWPAVKSPQICFPLEGDNLSKVMALESEVLSDIERLFAEFADDIAAILVEPIQTEEDRHFRPEFHRALRESADRHEALLVYDETETGFGITGKMWAHEQYGLLPDIVCFGGAAQVSGILAGERISQVTNHVFEERGRLNSCWGGKLTDMMLCQQYLEIVEEEGLLENAARVGEYLLQGIVELAARRPDVFANARGRGLLCAVTVSSTAKRDALCREILRRGAVVMRGGRNEVRFRPALTFSRKEVDELLAIVDQSQAAVS